MQLSVRQRRILALLAEEPAALRVPAELCPPPAMQSLVRRGLVKGTARGYRITKHGQKEIS